MSKLKITPISSTRLKESLGTTFAAYESAKNLPDKYRALTAAFEAKTMPEKVQLLERALGYDEGALAEQIEAAVISQVDAVSSQRAAEIAATVGVPPVSGEYQGGSAAAAQLEDVRRQITATADPAARSKLAAKAAALRASL